jgi:uncharacterized RDD family membrane protein YckC
MTVNASRAFGICVFAAALAGGTAAAQAPAPGGPAPPPVTTAEQAPPEPQPEHEFRMSRRPVVRVGLDYGVRAGDSVSYVQTVLGDVTIDGHVDQDVVVTLGSVRLGSTAVIDGSLAVLGGSATIADGAVVNGDFVLVGGPLDAPERFYARGTQVVVGMPAVTETVKAAIPWLTHGLLLGRLIVPSLRWVWVVVAVIFLVGVVLNLLFDRPVRGCANAIVAKPLSSFLLGLFVLLLTPLAVAIIGATIIGLAIVPLVLCAIVAAAIVGKVGVARAIGGTIVQEGPEAGRAHALVSFAIGFAVLCLAYMVPIVGIVTWALTGALGLGAAAITFRVSLKKEHPERAPVPEVAAAAAMPVAYSPSSTSDFDSAPPPFAVDSTATPPPVPPARSGLAAYARAAFLDRVAAFALDCILVAIAVEILDLNRYSGAFLFWLFAYHVGFWAWRGTTLGGIVIGLRVVRTQGTELRVIDAVVRALASIFSVAALGIGCLWMLQDPERQMWHDKIAGTLVVKVPREMLLP